MLNLILKSLSKGNKLEAIKIVWDHAKDWSDTRLHFGLKESKYLVDNLILQHGTEHIQKKVVTQIDAIDERREKYLKSINGTEIKLPADAVDIKGFNTIFAFIEEEMVKTNLNDTELIEVHSQYIEWTNNKQK